MILSRLTHFIVLGALAVSACSKEKREPQPSPNPILYEIAGADGSVEGWMLGTIHALPNGTQWQTAAIERTIDRADYLIVEVANLEDRDAVARVFTQLATTPGQPHLSSRIRPQLRPALIKAVARSDYSMEDFSDIETWAAALTLARIAVAGDTANGVDRAVIRDFSDREVREFEGALDQLRIFDNLPAADQRDLLEGVLTEIEMANQQPDWLRNGWLTGDEAVLAQATRTGIMADPQLYDALLVTRNRRWTAMLVEYLPARERPLIAVGAGHLVGPDSIGAMLEKRGYAVRRLH